MYTYTNFVAVKMFKLLICPICSYIIKYAIDFSSYEILICTIHRVY